jgi:site-specific DNA recombinase
LLYVVQQEAKHAYLRDLSRNVARGSLASARSDKRHGTGGGGPRLFGYRTQADGSVEIVETEAAVVRRIFDLYLQPGSSLRSVANILNSEGIKTAAGGNWTAPRIRNTLTTQKYTGAFVRFRTAAGKYHAIIGGEIVPRCRSDKQIEQDPLIVVEGNHAAIISQAVFDQAQAKLAANRKETAPRGSFPYVFRGLLRCSECGGVMLGHAGRSYLCGTYHRAGKAACHSNLVSEELLIGGIVRLIRDRYCSDAAIGDLRTALRRELAAERKQGAKPVDQRRLTKRIETLDRQLDQAAERVLVAPAALADRLTSKLGELQEQRDRLQSELDAARRTETAPERLTEETVEAAIGALRGLQERLSDADPEALRELVSGLIVQIVLEFEHTPQPGGKRISNRLTGGRLIVRPDQALSSLLSHTASSGSPIRSRSPTPD